MHLWRNWISSLQSMERKTLDCLQKSVSFTAKRHISVAEYLMVTDINWNH